LKSPWQSYLAPMLFLVPLLCGAQQYRLSSGAPTVSPGKTAAELHFQSKYPRPDSQNAIPGRRLLELAPARAAQLRSRIRASRISARTAGANPPVFPGIQFRDSSPGGSIPVSVVTGDFDKDGHMDYAVANGGTNDLWIYFGKGNGTFQLPRIVPLTKGQSPVYLVTADLRGNGTLDLIVAEFDTSTIGVLLGNGDGTFQFEQEYTLPQPPEALVVDDFNHDGKLDIAAVMYTLSGGTAGVDYIATLAGDGAGHFSSTPVITKSNFYSTAWNIASGDVNNDGLPDVIITGPVNDDSRVYLNNGDGTFTAGQTIVGDNPPFDYLYDARFGDVNEDGCLDAVVADFNSYVWVSLGDCAGHFATPTRVAMGDSSSAVRLVDLNGDGHLDIVTTAIPAADHSLGDVAGDTLSVAFGDGHGNFTRARDYVGTGESYSLAIADFNGDGKPDVVTSNTTTDTTTVYLNDGSGSFGFPQGAYVGLGTGGINVPITPVSFADLTGNGKPDVLLLDEDYGGEYIAAAMLNDGTGRFSGPITSDTGISIVKNQIGDYRLGDFRNTGHLDLVAVGLSAEYSGSTSFILFAPGNGDGSFGTGVFTPTSGANGELTIGDFNRDGKLDIVVVSPSSDLKSKVVTTYLGNGDGTFRSAGSVSIIDSAGDITRVFAADFNRDGKLDVLLYDTSNGYWTTQSNVWEFLGNGDGTFQAGRNLFAPFQPFALADVNGDQIPDLVRYDFFWPDGTTETYGSATFTTYLDKSDGSFAKSSSYSPYSGVPLEMAPYFQTGDPAATSLVADLNGDGALDALAFQQVSKIDFTAYLQILMGNGDGTFTPTYDVFPFYKRFSYPKYAHDLDGDGRTDLLELDGATSSMHVFKGAPAPALQIQLNESQVIGTSACGWIFPNVPATSDRSVTLSSSVSGVTLPASLTIAAGSLSQQFCYSLASNYDWHQVFDIRAQFGSDVAIAYASQSYVAGYAETLSPNTEQVIYPSQSTAPVTINLTSSQGYSSTVQLHCEGLPAGATCVFGSNTLTVSPAAVATTTVVVRTTSATPASSLPLYVVASDSNNDVRQFFMLTVYPLVVVSPFPVNTTSPGTASVDLFILGLPPYTPSCSGLPPRVVCKFSGSQLPYPGETDLGLTVTVPTGIAAGVYPFTVSVASGGVTSSNSATLNVVDFALQPPTTALDWAPPGGTTTVSPIVQPLNNLTNTVVSLTCSLDSGGTCTGASTLLVGNSPWAAPLTVSIPPGTAPGSHTLSVTLNAGSISHTGSFPFYIADYSGTLSAASLNLTPGTSASLTATINVTTGFGGAVAFSCNGSSQVTCVALPTTVQPTAGTPTTSKITFTAGLSAAMPPPPHFFGAEFLSMGMFLPAGILVGFGCFGWKRAMRAGAALFLLTVAFVLVSCGGTGGTGNGGAGSHGSNSYTVSVSAAAANTGTSRSLGTVTVSVTH